MGNILYAWELGQDYGHINRFLALAPALTARGHQPMLAARDLSQLEKLAPGFSFPVWQAPVWLPQVSGLPDPPLSYPEILHRSGYLHADGLLGLVKAWRSIYAQAKPDLIIADHAPTALLAAIGLDIPRALCGTGFLSPPRVTPLPSMRPWLDTPAQRLQNSEALALQSINDVLSKLKQPGLLNLAQLFHVAEDFLLTFPELDHYRERGPARYWGPMIHRGAGVKPAWPDGAGKKIFAYLKPRYKQFKAVMDRLRASPHRVLVHAPGLSADEAAKLRNAHVSISLDPIDMRYAEAECDVAICHGGFATTVGMLLSGRPLLVLSMHLEQALTGRNVAELGAGLALSSDAAHKGFAAALARLVKEPAFAQAAQAFAARHAHDFPQELAGLIADRCGECIARVAEKQNERGAG